MAAIALVARLGLAACDDLIAVTRHVETSAWTPSPWCNHYGLLPSGTDLKQDPLLQRRLTRLD